MSRANSSDLLAIGNPINFKVPKTPSGGLAVFGGLLCGAAFLAFMISPMSWEFDSGQLFNQAFKTFDPSLSTSEYVETSVSTPANTQEEQAEPTYSDDTVQYSSVSDEYANADTSVPVVSTSTPNGDAIAQAQAEGYILPSNWVYLDRADIEGFDERTTTLAINELYARYGYPFGNGQYRAYFDARPWYQAIDGVTEPNFTDIERANLDLLVIYSQEHGWR